MRSSSSEGRGCKRRERGSRNQVVAPEPKSGERAQGPLPFPHREFRPLHSFRPFSYGGGPKQRRAAQSPGGDPYICILLCMQCLRACLHFCMCDDGPTVASIADRPTERERERGQETAEVREGQCILGAAAGNCSPDIGQLGQKKRRRRRETSLQQRDRAACRPSGSDRPFILTKFFSLRRNAFRFIPSSNNHFLHISRNHELATLRMHVYGSLTKKKIYEFPRKHFIVWSDIWACL